jgi:pilus assembly protein Flp/PilA
MNRAKQLLSNLLTDESGQDLIEYALIAAALSLVAIAAEASITPKIQNEFNQITNNF